MMAIFEEILRATRDSLIRKYFFIMHSLWEEAAGVTTRSSTSTFKTDFPER
jgi:hypothetical protein